jgi:hypothetical protein
MHQGSATERAHAVRDRPIREAARASSFTSALRVVKETGAMRLVPVIGA